jgi:queuine tRNA-ribosyltransferase
MIEFGIQNKSKKSRARLGFLKTKYGVVETPAFVPVATQAVMKTMTSGEAEEAGSQLLIANTYHLHLRPGERMIKLHGGLHRFMNWKKPLMTDSGGFQVFSLGFGMDHGVGKILKKKTDIKIKFGDKPKAIKISENGVTFRSPIDGRKIFIGPKESIRIQEDLGADIIFAFDECTSPVADYKYTAKSLEKTHRWAKICIEAKKSDQALYGIVQGGKFKELRIRSAKFIGKLPFAGFGIGGEFGDEKGIMIKMLDWVIKELPVNKPRHLLGIGGLEDIPKIIKSGVDTFDCIIPTHYARRGIAFVPSGRIDLNKSMWLKDKSPLDKKCDCFVCQGYSKGYIAHLFKAKEITAMKLVTFHNVYFFNKFVEKIRKGIRMGKV